MIYHDAIYGSAEINSPILIDLIHSNAMQRLKGVLQAGITGLLGITRPTTRFEHSIGTMLVVRELGGSVAEQIAALLHDVSHTAFSHVIDHVFDTPSRQSYHDDKKEEYVARTDIPIIMTAHGYNWRDFLQEEDFPILEQPSPALCADRVDYYLRDAVPMGQLNADDIALIRSHLVIVEGQIAVDDATLAQRIGKTFIACDDGSWSNFHEVGLYELTARIIRRGLALGAISESDVWGTDATTWAKLTAFDNEPLQAAIALLQPETQFVWDADNPTFSISTKIRTVDPAVVVDGKLIPLSQLDADFGRFRSAYIQRKQGIWPMRLIPPNGEKIAFLHSFGLNS
jgi:hypothetical protein